MTTPSHVPFAIYVVQHRTETAQHVMVALSELLIAADRIIVVADTDNQENVETALSDLNTQARIEVIPSDRGASVLSAYRMGLLHILSGGAVSGPVMLTGYHVFGPVCPGGWQDIQTDVDLFCPYWHNATLDVRLQGRSDMPDHLPYLDFAVMSADLVNSPAFRHFWERLPPFTDYWDEIERGLLPFARYLRDHKHSIAYGLPDAVMQTSDPRHYEVHKLVEHGAPCLPISCLTLDPLIHDLNGIDLRSALDQLRASNPTLYAAVIAFASARVPLRSFTTIADQYEVLSPHYPLGRQSWRFGKVAVFIHAFYADMMPEFWAHIAKFPMPAHLFLSTATAENKDEIEAFLDAQGWPAADRTVRVVEQNRGRDMSSLFITFRDIALSGDYDVALRLHSKRTPQVTRQVAEGFKAHLFDNLVHSPGAISQLLDRFEAEPDIGLVIPPVIHVGFGTLGHSWYTNRGAVQEQCRRMGLSVPLDIITPVAPYGTMFWFRMEALRPMFACEWQWDEYNPEPNHVDGGLAHVQERLIGYAAQASGFRVLQVMSPELAARNYARLEYKLQLFASRLASHHVLDQLAQLDRGAETLNARTDRRLRIIYSRIIGRFPRSRAFLKPMARRVALLLNPGYHRGRLDS